MLDLAIRFYERGRLYLPVREAIFLYNRGVGEPTDHC